MTNLLFNELNPQQQEAVTFVNGPSVILAGAGSGKTRVLVYKVLNLILNHKISSKSIIMITFTNKASSEMKQRIFRQLPTNAGNLGFTGTFHSLCLMILRAHGRKIGLDPRFIIYDEGDQMQLVKNIIQEKDIKRYSAFYFLNRISAAKNQLITPDRYLNLFSDNMASTVFEVYKSYENQLRKNRAVDFDDLIMKTAQLFMRDSRVLEQYQNRYIHILVDEFQDTNYSQYVLVKLLGQKYKNVTVVGDFSQSIYSWRGADIQNLEKFSEDFPGTKLFYLEQNYRSTQSILDFAYSVISKNQSHPILNLFTENKKGEQINLKELENEEYEAFFIASEIKSFTIPYSSIAVLYRTNAQSRIIEESFLHYGIPYILVGGTRFYERKDVKDVLSYLRLFINPNDTVSKDRIVKIGKKRWSSFKDFYTKKKSELKKTSTDELMEHIFDATGYLQLYDPDTDEDYARLENIKELKSVAVRFPVLNEFLEQVALVESEYSEGEKKNKSLDGVRMMTLHQAKGLEFPIVFISGVEEGILPHSRSIDDLFQLEEERRLFYVGITRAKEKLYITSARRRFIFGRRNETAKSRFIQEDTSLWEI